MLHRDKDVLLYVRYYGKCIIRSMGCAYVVRAMCIIHHFLCSIGNRYRNYSVVRKESTNSKCRYKRGIRGCGGMSVGLPTPIYFPTENLNIGNKSIIF